MFTGCIYCLTLHTYITNPNSLDTQTPTDPTQSTYCAHTMLACDAEGLRVDLAAAAVSALGSWISSGITAPVDGSCCIKFRHASTYLVKMKTATTKKKWKGKNKLACHASCTSWEVRAAMMTSGQIVQGWQPCRFFGYLTACACRGTHD